MSTERPATLNDLFDVLVEIRDRLWRIECEIAIVGSNVSCLDFTPDGPLPVVVGAPARPKRRKRAAKVKG